MRKLVEKEIGQQEVAFIEKYIKLDLSTTLVVHTTNSFNIVSVNREVHSVVNLSILNNIRYINKFLETVNEKLENGDFICIRAETISARKQRKYNRQPKFWRNILFLFEFVFLRVFPKVWFLKKIYFAVTRGRNRLLSKAEILGRMVCCGFRIVEIESFNGFVHVIAQKENLPFYDLEASYGPIFAMKRIGRGGEIFKVFKLRTMHPYSEYLQDYVLNLNGYAQTGKPDNDFRLTPWGKWFRRLWIDELPQLLNVLRGEMNLVGVRPVTQRYMQDIPEELREKRLKFKPGCIPPYVALGMKGSVNEVLKAEEIYLNERMKKGKWVDVKYFFMALKNIIFKRKRSA